MNTFAALADIHGNTWALDAVLADIDHRGINSIINLGDTIYGPLDPQSTAERLMNLPCVSIQGNQDREIIKAAKMANADLPATLKYVLKNSTLETRDWLSSFPFSCVVDQTFFLCHGTPHSDETYLLEDINRNQTCLKPEQGIMAQIVTTPQKLILCGHSHLQRIVRLPDGHLVVNPGSVGLPAYQDDLPAPHKMENGSPHARYAILYDDPSGWKVEQIAIPYDWEKAAAAARKNGREDWAVWLTTGRA